MLKWWPSVGIIRQALPPKGQGVWHMVAAAKVSTGSAHVTRHGRRTSSSRPPVHHFFTPAPGDADVDVDINNIHSQFLHYEVLDSHVLKSEPYFVKY